MGLRRSSVEPCLLSLPHRDPATRLTRRQNTFTTVSIDGTTFTNCSHRHGDLHRLLLPHQLRNRHEELCPAIRHPLGPAPLRRGDGVGIGWCSSRALWNLRPQRRGAGEEDASSGSGESDAVALVRDVEDTAIKFR